jgi:hypothetical protein
MNKEQAKCAKLTARLAPYKFEESLRGAMSLDAVVNIFFPRSAQPHTARISIV